MPYTFDKQEYHSEQKTRLINYFKINRAKLCGFTTAQQFIDWYALQLDENSCKCHYCEISILDIRRLLNSGIINGRKVKGQGLRGPNLEIDRKDANGIYSEANCVLCCYYCNNDKSNTYSYDFYKTYMGPARKIAMQQALKLLDDF